METTKSENRLRTCESDLFTLGRRVGVLGRTGAGRLTRTTGPRRVGIGGKAKGWTVRMERRGKESTTGEMDERMGTGAGDSSEGEGNEREGVWQWFMERGG